MTHDDQRERMKRTLRSLGIDPSDDPWASLEKCRAEAAAWVEKLEVSTDRWREVVGRIDRSLERLKDREQGS